MLFVFCLSVCLSDLANSKTSVCWFWTLPCIFYQTLAKIDIDTVTASFTNISEFNITILEITHQWVTIVLGNAFQNTLPITMQIFFDCFVNLFGDRSPLSEYFGFVFGALVKIRSKEEASVLKLNVKIKVNHGKVNNIQWCSRNVSSVHSSVYQTIWWGAHFKTTFLSLWFPEEKHLCTKIKSKFLHNTRSKESGFLRSGNLGIYLWELPRNIMLPVHVKWMWWCFESKGPNVRVSPVVNF